MIWLDVDGYRLLVKGIRNGNVYYRNLTSGSPHTRPMALELFLVTTTPEVSNAA